VKNRAYSEERLLMVERQLQARDIRDPNVLRAMQEVPRHEFVPDTMKKYAYNDEPLPIGEGQTISQPYIVAYMTEALKLRKSHRVLEVGTGSGYQTAVLAEIAGQVFSVEIVASLSLRAQATLSRLGYDNIQFKTGDGTLGWPESAPYDAVIVTAAPAMVPSALEDQLQIGGRMIVPVGEASQDLVLLYKEKRKTKRKTMIAVRFVPMVAKSD